MNRDDIKVLTYGVFDTFEMEHVQFLRYLSQLGHCLIVGLSTDRYLAAQGRATGLSFERRRARLKACRYVDLIIPEDHPAQKRTDIVNHNISIFAMTGAMRGEFDSLSDIARVEYVEALHKEDALFEKALALTA